ncbi:MmpS family transport accessory protein [Streptomyces sp. 11x1]|uniref:MmpS family transport accessory protein n=1 Tax=Streptomyces sp. 11x1 TaxID=3038642 RepID=UPI002930DF35|nr:MmpS family transport accessory protein [Streptomyces sp. 11x1]WNZ10817.1 MmpS family transport accessory protein [Streptomyces sp. 11x1]
MPPARDGHRARWFLWSLGVLLLATAGVATVLAAAGDPGEPSLEERARQALQPTRHTVVYQVTSPGSTSALITYRANGINNDKSVDNAKLPWKEEVTITAGPGAAVAQVMAAGGKAGSVSCSIRIDGRVVDKRTAKGQFTDVSCSSVVQPGAE